ncbi:malto-oligosyltrehalose trehalohydrolase [Micromonospora sp. LOL_024]|uniref:malto-oligosyltrehalose trehalohydrolase n=1 Tax=Micromonospora sp. LOL_024 TaxID=3345412 RepID=UPI003A83DB3C
MTEFTVWAPEASRVRLSLPGTADHEMRTGQGGWWRVQVPGAGPDYCFLLDDDDQALPDPRSGWQPAGAHGPSRIYDHAAFGWTDQAWTGRQLPGSVLYELHVGTFTPEGTFDAAVGRLDHLVELGVDLIELLPVNAFNGEHNWGYDGVCWFAPHEPYGGPDGLKRLVDAAHAKGLGVILDVVYNHFGPSGAYAPMFAPYLAERNTPWGSAVNLDGPHSDGVRRFVADSVLMWLRDYHVDGLRLDAVHAMPDTRATHLLEELAVEVESLSVHLGRPLTLIAESDLNDPRLISSREAGGYGLHAQWNDDAHHALHALLTGERQGYYGDFGTMECLAEVLTGGFFHTGTWSSFRSRQHGRPVDPRTPGHRFVAYLQNHDQIGNRATGDRLAASLSPALLRVGATLLLTAPFTPMLFMGEEWAAATPWQYFTSHPEPELASAVVNGRRSEFAAHGWPPGDVPDPQDRQTFVRSRLDWAELDKPEHRAMYEFYRRLIALRKSRPELSDPHLFAIDVRHGDRFLVMRRGGCLVAANLADKPQRVTLPGVARRVLLATGEGVTVQRDRIELPAETAAIVAL